MELKIIAGGSLLALLGSAAAYAMDMLSAISLALLVVVLLVLVALTTLIVVSLIRFNGSADKIERAIVDLSVSVKTMAQHGSTINHTHNEYNRSKTQTQDVHRDLLLGEGENKED